MRKKGNETQMRIQEKICYILSIFCVILGGLLRFIFTAARFTGFLLWSAAIVLLLYAFLTRLSRRYAWARQIKRVLLIFLTAGILLFTALEAWVISEAKTDKNANPEAIVILGAGVNGTEPSLSLETRLRAAYYYIMEVWPDCPVVVTGSQGRGEDISEARCMAAWLVERGVPPERLLLEEQANTTEENVRYSKALLSEYGVPDGAETAIVTSGYHLCRAKRLWGEGAAGIAACMPERYWPLTANYYIREAFAMAALLVL